MRKQNVTDRQTDRGRCNISRPGPSAPWEIIIRVPALEMRVCMCVRALTILRYDSEGL